MLNTRVFDFVHLTLCRANRVRPLCDRAGHMTCMHTKTTLVPSQMGGLRAPSVCWALGDLVLVDGWSCTTLLGIPSYAFQIFIGFQKGLGGPLRSDCRQYADLSAVVSFPQPTPSLMQEFLN
jgi:hypothetical protein